MNGNTKPPTAELLCQCLEISTQAAQMSCSDRKRRKGLTDSPINVNRPTRLERNGSAASNKINEISGHRQLAGHRRAARKASFHHKRVVIRCQTGRQKTFADNH